MDSGSPTPWHREGSVQHADCRVFRILKEKWTSGDKRISEDFFIMDVSDWAVVLAQTSTGKWVLVRQFRFGIGDFSWEFPAGLLDTGESPLEGALRELYEETGYRGDRAEVIGIVHPNPAVQRNRCHIVLVEGARREGEGDPDPHESFEVREVDENLLETWACDGTITHGIVHSALYFLGKRSGLKE